MKIPKNSVLIEYPEFILKGKRNFILFVDIRDIENLEVDGYVRHAYHSNNLLFLENKPKEIDDYLLYPLQQKYFSYRSIFFSEILRKNGKFLHGKVELKELDIKKSDLLKFASFSFSAAEATIKTLYYNFDINKHKFIFWYASLDTIIKASFSYLLTEGIYEIDTKKILGNMKEFGFADFNFDLVLDCIETQEVKDVEKLYELSCKFIDRLGERILKDLEKN